MKTNYVLNGNQVLGHFDTLRESWTLEEAVEMAAIDTTQEALDSVPQGSLTPQERTRLVVAATGNKWAMENFNATHN